MNKRALPLIMLLISSLALTSGCVKRNLNIISDPPGATIYLNDKEIGVTPIDFDFMHYATYKVALQKEGYETLEELVSIKTPLYLWIPFDLICELMPYTFWDRRELSYTLKAREN